MEPNKSPLSKFLVAACMDRGGTGINQDNIEELRSRLGFDKYFKTSAIEHWNIKELHQAIREAIPWNTLPKTNWVSPINLLDQVMKFLIEERETGRILSPIDDLFLDFVRSPHAPDKKAGLHTQFEVCIRSLEWHRLVRKFSFKHLVLLQPELLDYYASALTNAVRAEENGMGTIEEESVRTANFFIPTEKRLQDRAIELFLLIEMVEELLRHEFILHEQTNDGTYLVFPSQFTNENPDMPDPKEKAVIFSFKGPIQNIYATLAVRLSHSGRFIKQKFWRNALTYTTEAGGTHGILLDNKGEGKAELTLFFKGESKKTRATFHDFVYNHLKSNTAKDSVERRPIFVCPDCGIPMPDSMTRARSERGFNWLICPVCDTHISLLDSEEKPTDSEERPTAPTLNEDENDIANDVATINQEANRRRDSEAETFVIENAIQTTIELEGNGERDDEQTLTGSNDHNLAEVLQALKEAVERSRDLPEDEKQEHIRTITRMSEEIAKPAPDQSRTQRLGNGLVAMLKDVSDVKVTVKELASLLQLSF